MPELDVEKFFFTNREECEERKEGRDAKEEKIEEEGLEVCELTNNRWIAQRHEGKEFVEVVLYWSSTE